MICCGEEVVTLFCPQCGKRCNKQFSLEGLLQHLKNTISKLIKERDTCLGYTRESERTEANLSKLRKRLNRMTNSVEKWQLWIDALEIVIKESNA